MDSSLFHQHHVTPQAFGGGDEETNLVWLCATCHDILHRMALWMLSDKKGHAKDVAQQYLPNSPAARERLNNLAKEVAKAKKDYVPKFDEDGDEDTVIVQLHLPRSLHHKLKTLASDHTNPKSGRKMGLYNYIAKVLERHAYVSLISAGPAKGNANLFGAPAEKPETTTKTTSTEPLLQEIE